MTKKKLKRERISKKIITYGIKLTETALERLKNGEKWVWVPYDQLIVVFSSFRRLYDILLFLTILGWEKVEISGEHYVVLRAKNYEEVKEKLEAIRKTFLSR